MGTAGRSAPRSRAMAAGLELEAPQLWLQGGGVRFTALCIPQARCSLSHARDLLAAAVRPGQEALRGQLCLELLNSGQKQRKGRPRLVLLQNKAHDPWEGAAGQRDTELSLCTKTIHYTSQETR